MQKIFGVLYSILTDVQRGSVVLRLYATISKTTMLTVLEEYRNKNVGLRLMKFVQSFAKNNFPNLLHVAHGQFSVIKFYKKLGWIALNKTIIHEQNIGCNFIIYPKEIVHLLERLMDENNLCIFFRCCRHAKSENMQSSV